MSEEQKNTKTETSEQAGMTGPMAMAMEMARKMMAQMGKGGPGPMAMMQKMMAQMGQGQEVNQEGGPSLPPMMQMCMGMCAEMLAAMKRTTDMAAFATPELNRLFTEWLESLEEEALRYLKEQGEADVAALAAALKISGESATYLVAHLLQSSKVSVRIQAAQESL